MTKEEIKEYKLVDMVTQTTPAIQTPNGDTIRMEEALIEILNKLDNIEKRV